MWNSNNNEQNRAGGASPLSLDAQISQLKSFVDRAQAMASEALIDENVAHELDALTPNDLGLVTYNGLEYLKYGKTLRYEIEDREVEYAEEYEAEEEVKKAFGKTKTIKVKKLRPAKKIVQERVPVEGGTAYYSVVVLKALMQRLETYRRGSVVEFGKYPQATAFGQFYSMNEGSPIRWLVLDFNQTTMEILLISESILDCKRYHNIKQSITWKDSDIRRWLNTEFYDSAFSEHDKNRIVMSQCRGNGVESANDLPETEDYVFLLNSNEAKMMGTDEHRKTAGTDFAKEKKADECSLYTYGWDGRSRWWLRNRGKGGVTCCAYVADSGNVYTHGHDVNDSNYGVRPAIRITP